jgi:transcriptional regulator of arginine metabolism
VIKSTKKNRQSYILSIIQNEDIATQEELVDRLRKNNWKVTQATVSRDIKELGLNKITGENHPQKYVVNSDPEDSNTSKLINVFSQAVASYESAGTIVVIKTLPGMAPASASAIDSLNLQEVVGTIAGDDTIFIATKSSVLAGRLVERIKEILKQQ